MTRKASFKQDDVARAVRGCIAAGMEVGCVSISPDGTIAVSSVDEVKAQRENSVDRVLGWGLRGSGFR